MTTTLHMRPVALKMCLICIIAAPACAANPPIPAENARATIQKLTGDWSYAAGVVVATNAYVTSNGCRYYVNGARMPSDGEQTYIGCGLFVAYTDNSWDWILPGLYENSGGLWLVEPFKMTSETGLGTMTSIGSPVQAVAGHTYQMGGGRLDVVGGHWEYIESAYDETSNTTLWTYGNFTTVNTSKAIAWTALTYSSESLAPLSQYDEATAQFDDGFGYAASVTTDNDPNGPQTPIGVQTLITDYGFQTWSHNQPSGPGFSVFWDVPSATVNVNNLALK